MQKRELAARALDSSGLGWLLRKMPVWNGLVALAYHRIGDRDQSPFPSDVWSATAEGFDLQVRAFKRDFDVVGVGDLDEIVRRGRRGRFLQITFDDGYADNFAVAYPILKSHGVPATFFITSGFLDGTTFPWWDELAWILAGSKKLGLGPRERDQAIQLVDKAVFLLFAQDKEAFLDLLGQTHGTGRCPESVRRSAWMTWDDVRKMRRGGMTIGAHTMSHPMLSRLSRAEQDAEIGGGKRRVEAEIGEAVTAFAYPYGGKRSFNADTRAVLAAQGLAYAYTYYGGYQLQGKWESHDLRRIIAQPDISGSSLSAMATLPQVFAAYR